MSSTDRQQYIKLLEASIEEHEGIISTLHEQIARLYEAERQDNIQLFIQRTGLTDVPIEIVTSCIKDES